MVAADDGIGQARGLSAHSTGGGPGEQASAWLLPAALCALVAFFLYLPALRYALVFDDLSLLSAEGPRSLGTVLMPYRPVRYLSYRLDYWLGGGEVWVYHLVNILVHSLLCALSVVLAYRLGARRWTLVLAGLLPATHPLAVEAVAYVSGRRDLLAALFGTAALLAWTGRRYPRSFAAVLLLAAVAAKESALVFVPVLALASLCGIGPRKVLLPLTGAGAVAAALLLSYGAIGPWFPQAGFSGLRRAAFVLLHYLQGLSGFARLNVEYPKLGRFTGAAFEPYVAAGAFTVLSAACLWAASRVFAAARRDRAERLGSVAACEQALPLGAAMGTIANGGARHGDGPLPAVQERQPARVRCRADSIVSVEIESRRSALFVVCWVLLNFAVLSAYAGLHEPGADRHAYPLLISLGAAAALLLSGAGRSKAALAAVPAVARTATTPALSLRWQKVALAAFFLVVAAWSLQSSLRMEVWRDEHSLWSSAVAAAPGSARARHNWAVVLAGEGKLERAMKQERRALSIDPSYSSALIGRAALLCSKRRPQRTRNALALALAGGAPPGLVQDLGRSCRLPEYAAVASPAPATVAIASSYVALDSLPPEPPP